MSWDLIEMRADLGAILFTDEKRFCLDGPDGNIKCWYNEKENIPKPVLIKRQQRGKSVMAWVGFMGKEKAPLFFFQETISSASYTQNLLDNVMPWYNNLEEAPALFQQDNASSHVAKDTIKFFESQNIELLSWPAHSPDLNPVELIWAELSRQVYKNCKTYTSLKTLKENIMTAWNSLDPIFLENILVETWKRLLATSIQRGNFSKLEKEILEKLK